MAFYGASASDLRPGIGALRQHAWDGYVEPSSTEGEYRRTPVKKQASIFISEEDHAKLRGMDIENNVNKVTQGHHRNPKIEYLMNKEARALQKRNTKSRKNRKKLYANIKRDSIASASGRSLALSVVNQTAQAAMSSQNHHHKTNKDEDTSSKASDYSIPVSDHGLGLQYTGEHPLSLPTGKLLSNKTFLLGQEMKISIKKTKERQVIISVIDNNFREYALVKTEQDLVDVLENDEDKDRFCKLERKLKLQLISSMVTFASSKSHGKLKRLALALPPRETVAIFLRSEVQDFDEEEQGNEEITSKPSLASIPTKKVHAGKGWLKAKVLLQKINISKYRQLIRSSPLDPKGYTSLGKLYLKHNRLKEGIGLFRSAIRLKDVNLQAKPFSPSFWKKFVTVLNEYNHRQTHTEMRDLLEAKQAFDFSLRFFENLTDPNYLYLGASIQQEAGDIENSCQTLARIIQNFPSFKKMRKVVLRAAACELHAGNLPQSQSYFEFLLIDPPAEFTKDDIVLFVSLLLRLNKREESAMKGFQFLYKKLYDKGGIYQEGLYKKKTVASWSKCSELWIDVAQKMLEKNELLLANNLFKEGLFLQSDLKSGLKPVVADDKHLAETSSELLEQSLSSISIVSINESQVSPTAPITSIGSDDGANNIRNNAARPEKAEIWWKAATCAYFCKDFDFATFCCEKTLLNDPLHKDALQAKRVWEVPQGSSSGFKIFKLSVEEEIFLDLEARKSYSKPSQKMNLKKQNSSIPGIVEFEDSYFPSTFVKTSDANVPHHPMSQKQRSIVKRLHEGYDGEEYLSALTNRKLSRGKKFTSLLSRALNLKKSKRQTGLTKQTHGATQGSPLGPTSPTTMLSMRHSLKTIAPKFRAKEIVENLKKEDAWNLSNLNSTMKKVRVKRQRRKVKNIKVLRKIERKIKQKHIFGSKVGMPVAYSTGATSGVLPDGVAIRPPLYDTMARKSAHDFFEREVARKQERMDYLKRLESKSFDI